MGDGGGGGAAAAGRALAAVDALVADAVALCLEALATDAAAVVACGGGDEGRTGAVAALPGAGVEVAHLDVALEAVGEGEGPAARAAGVWSEALVY